MGGLGAASETQTRRNAVLKTLKRPWWDRYGEIRTKSVEGLPTDIAMDFLDICHSFIQQHAAEAERHGWQPAHLLGPKGIGRAWALIRFFPTSIRWEPMTMIYPSPSHTVIFARRAHRNGSTSIIMGEDYLALCTRHVAMFNGTGIDLPIVG